jgi:AmmeMemoRadiSam system protein A
VQVDTSLEPEQRRALLNLARDAIGARLGNLPPPQPTTTDDALGEPRGAFVTLTIDGMLRGCIGHVEPVEPLWMSVRSNAVAAAFRDPRFDPLAPDELDRVRIEISVMSPLVRLRDPSTFTVGVHGLMIERGPARGLLLPQVARDHRWDRQTFLEHTCRKAGLDLECWKDPTSVLHTFTVESFAEE